MGRVRTPSAHTRIGVIDETVAGQGHVGLGSFTSFPPSRRVRFAPREDSRPMRAFMSTRPNLPSLPPPPASATPPPGSAASARRALEELQERLSHKSTTLIGCPLSPHKRHKSGHFLTAASCQNRTHAPQQIITTANQVFMGGLHHQYVRASVSDWDSGQS